MRPIYLDNAATTRVLPQSADTALRIMTETYANPSSVHGMGGEAAKELKAARTTLLSALGASEKTHELYFTASGTEADNLAVLGYARRNVKRGNRILMGASEHPAVFGIKEELEKLGYEVLLVPNTGGEIDYSFVERYLTPKTVLITHMLVNNETGALYDIKELISLRNRLSPSCRIHTDAVQGFLKTGAKMTDTNADMIAVSAHKIHAPKGVGALLCRKGLLLAPLIFGGGQENGLRSGTEALPGICAFAESAAVLSEKEAGNYRKVSALRAYTKERLLAVLPQAVVHEAPRFSPYILNFSLPHIKSEVMLRYLSEKEIYVSAGSACSSKHRENRVLTAFGLSNALADTALRVSFCEDNTKEEADELIRWLAQGEKSLAKMK